MFLFSQRYLLSSWKEKALLYINICCYKHHIQIFKSKADHFIVLYLTKCFWVSKLPTRLHNASPQPNSRSINFPANMEKAYGWTLRPILPSDLLHLFSSRLYFKDVAQRLKSLSVASNITPQSAMLPISDFLDWFWT